jgi:hypothetical protein
MSNRKNSGSSASTPPIRCSFCGKSKEKVGSLISGPSVYICNECIELALKLMEEGGHPIRYPGGRREFDAAELGLSPRFNKIRLAVRHRHCFHLCPFSEPFTSIYRDHVVPTVKSQGFSIERADEIYGTQPIIEDIWEGIASSAIIIADVTGRNPNVMYEIGMAHTVGRPYSVHR